MLKGSASESRTGRNHRNENLGAASPDFSVDLNEKGAQRAAKGEHQAEAPRRNWIAADESGEVQSSSLACLREWKPQGEL